MCTHSPPLSCTCDSTYMHFITHTHTHAQATTRTSVQLRVWRAPPAPTPPHWYAFARYKTYIPCMYYVFIVYLHTSGSYYTSTLVCIHNRLYCTTYDYMRIVLYMYIVYRIVLQPRTQNKVYCTVYCTTVCVVCRKGKKKKAEGLSRYLPCIVYKHVMVRSRVWGAHQAPTPRWCAFTRYRACISCTHVSYTCTY